MNRELDLILDDYLARLQSGEGLESCLASYSEQADELRPLLELATDVWAVPTPRSKPSVVRAGRWRMMDAVDAKFGAQPVSRAFLSRYTGRLIARTSERIFGKENENMKLTARFAILAVVVMLLLGGGRAVVVSSDALPGDTLYPLKLAVEDARLRFTGDRDQREQLELEFQAERQTEVRELMLKGREAEVRFWGELLALDDLSWNISGLAVELDAATVATGSPTLGATVKVQARTQANGTILARRLTVQDAPRSIPLVTPTPYPTYTPYPTLRAEPQDEAYTPYPTLTPVNTTHPFPFKLSDDGVMYETYPFSSSCDWLGIAGEVRDQDGNHIPGISVVLNGGGLQNIVTTSGNKPQFGASGWEHFVDNKVKEGDFTIQLWGKMYASSTDNQPVSEKVIVRTRADCRANMIYLVFEVAWDDYVAPSSLPRSTFTPIPSRTPRPTIFFTPLPSPTVIPRPTTSHPTPRPSLATSTPRPTSMPRPTRTPYPTPPPSSTLTPYLTPLPPLPTVTSYPILTPTPTPTPRP
jgi:hypothetical protein